MMRALFIALGVTLIHRFEWILYLFGAVLISYLNVGLVPVLVIVIGLAFF